MNVTKSLTALLNPKSIAVVGVSPRSRYGSAIMANAAEVGFAGRLYQVNPNYDELEGSKCYRSLAALPEVPDCAVVVVPARAVPDVIEEAGKLGVRSAVVVASGFAESRAGQGAARQARLRELAETYGMAIAGPNCLGISSLEYGFSTTYTELPKTRPGGISIISQSGGLLNAAASYIANRGGGLNYMVSFGNQAVVEAADYIRFLADDPKTTVIACIMEGAAEGRRFRAAVEEASQKKPIVIQKLGRSDSGQRATLAHTGTLAGDDRAFVTLFRQNGVAMTESLDSLMETALLFDAVTILPRGRRVGMVTISGGTVGLIADVGEAAGLAFPPFSAASDAALRKALGIDMPLTNPLDTTSWPHLTDPGKLDSYLDVLLADPEIDLVGLAFRLQERNPQRDLLANLARRARTAPKPVFCISTVSYTAGSFRRFCPEAADLPILEDLERGQRAVSHLIDYGLYRQRRESAGRSAPRPPLALDLPRRRASLTEWESKKILAKAGLPVTREILAATPGQAAEAARQIGFPVALKIQSPDLPHKSDVGGVALRIRSPEEAAQAYRRMIETVKAARADAEIDGVLVQEMVEGGTEMILGMSQGELGPVILLGLGGLWVEIMKDVALRFPPLDAADVGEMLGEIKGARLLDGYRGTPAGDIEALVETVVRFGDFVAVSDGRFAAIDLNPLIVRPRGQGVVVADALIVPAAESGNGAS